MIHLALFLCVTACACSPLQILNRLSTRLLPEHQHSHNKGHKHFPFCSVISSYKQIILLAVCCRRNVMSSVSNKCSKTMSLNIKKRVVTLSSPERWTFGISATCCNAIQQTACYSRARYFSEHQLPIYIWMSTNKNRRLVLFDRFVKYVLSREDPVMLNLMAT